MIIGFMKYQITIYSCTATALASGQESQTWTAGSTLFSSLDWVSAEEGHEGEQKVAEKVAKFTIHNIQSITPKDNRIYYNSKFYEIISVTPAVDDRYLEIIARQKDNDNVS